MTTETNKLLNGRTEVEHTLYQVSTTKLECALSIADAEEEKVLQSLLDIGMKEEDAKSYTSLLRLTSELKDLLKALHNEPFAHDCTITVRYERD